MPIAEVEGQQFEFPEGTSEAQMGEAIRQHFATQDEVAQRVAVETETQQRMDGAPSPAIPSQLSPQDAGVVDGQVQIEQETQRRLQPLTDEQPKEPSFFDRFKQLQPDQSKIARERILEPTLTMGSAAVAEPVAGLVGLATAPIAGTEQAQKAIEATREALTIQPLTEGGEQTLQTIGEAIAPVAEVLEPIPKALGDFTLDLTGSPALATAAHSAPILALELVGLKGLRNLQQGTRLIDDAGRPTKTLRKALDQRGLDFDSLSPEARSAIPDFADNKMLPGANTPAKASEKALIEQIKAGGRDDALAGLKVTRDRIAGEKIGVDKLGVEAMKQGFEPGLVQSIKTASPATRAKMRKMTGIMRQIKKSARKGVSNRPSDVVGDSLTGRIQFIRDKADIARKELNNIADTKLRGREIDIAPVVNKLQDSLDELDVNLVDGPGGIPKPEFRGSLISKDRTSQRVITDLIDLLGEGGRPDALRAHKLKKQLDIMIDFNKKSAEGLTDAGRNILKGIRKELNTAVRTVDPDYARVNDTLSQSLNALGSLDDAVGSIDIFGKGSNKALGTRMRALLSNQQGRIKIDNAVQSIDDTVSNLGGKFDDNIKDLVMFSDALDSRFGTTAKTSLAGQTEQAVRQAVEQGPTRTAFQKGAETIGKGAEKLRGVNEFNAFESMNSLLNR